MVQIREVPLYVLVIHFCVAGCFEGEDGVRMKRDVFGTLSSALQSSLQQGSGSLDSTATQRQLQTLARATPDVVEVCVCMCVCQVDSSHYAINITL